MTGWVVRFIFVFIHENCINIALCLPFNNILWNARSIINRPEHGSDEMCHIFEGAKEFVF